MCCCIGLRTKAPACPHTVIVLQMGQEDGSADLAFLIKGGPFIFAQVRTSEHGAPGTLQEPATAPSDDFMLPIAMRTFKISAVTVFCIAQLKGDSYG